MTAAEIQTLLQKEFPNYQMKVESCKNRHARILLYIDNSHLRPGGTVSGPSMMLLADLAMYAAILNTIGSVVLAVTTNLNINFLRKPKPEKNAAVNASSTSQRILFKKFLKIILDLKYNFFNQNLIKDKNNSFIIMKDQ